MEHLIGGVVMTQDFGDAQPDVIAWYKARQRESASRAVAQQRLVGAIDALRETGHSIRQIAAILDVPPTKVVRTMGTCEPRELYVPKVGSTGEEILSPGSENAAYWAAHNAAWSHFPPAQSEVDRADSGESPVQ